MKLLGRELTFNNNEIWHKGNLDPSIFRVKQNKYVTTTAGTAAYYRVATIPMSSIFKNTIFKVKAYTPTGTTTESTIIVDIAYYAGNYSSQTSAVSALTSHSYDSDTTAENGRVLRYCRVSFDADYGYIDLYVYKNSVVTIEIEPLVESDWIWATGSLTANPAVGSLKNVRVTMTAGFRASNIVATSADSATYSSYGTLGTTTISNTTDKTGRWAYFGYFTISYNASYLRGHCANIRVRLQEINHDGTKNLADLDDFVLILKASMPYHANSTEFNTKVPSIHIEIEGKTSISPNDVVGLVYSTSTSTKTIRFYIRLKEANTVYQINPEQRYGRSFATSSYSATTSYFYFTYAGTQTPVTSLPTPAQGSIVYAVKRTIDADTLNGNFAEDFALRNHTHTIANITNLQSTLNAKAPLASPNFTGVPTAPTVPNGTNTDQIATTKFVQNALRASGYGDMLKAVYDTNNDGIVDNADKLDGKHASSFVLKTGDTMSGDLKVAGDVVAANKLAVGFNNVDAERFRFEYNGSTGRLELWANSSDSGTWVKKVEFPKRQDDNDFSLLLGSNQVWHEGNFDPSTKSNVNHNHNLADLSEKSYNSLTDKPNIPSKVSELENDANYVTQEELDNAGYGDMRKAVYDTNGDGIVDNADKLDGKHASDFALASHTHTAGAITGNLETTKLTEPSYVTGNVTITSKPLFDVLRADRTAFLPASQIIIEKSIDGGVTWEDAGISDTNKARLFTGQRPSITIPRKDGNKNTDCMLRITITGMKYNVPLGTAETAKYNYWNSNYVIATERYFSAEDAWLWVSSGPDRIYCKVERATGGNPNNWITVREAFLSGWAGGNYIKLGGANFGGGTSQTGNNWNWRFTFRTATTSNDFDNAKLNQTYITSSQTIHHIKISGRNAWTSSNNLMYHDHLYTWDENQNVTFPASVTATTFNGNLSGKSASADKLATARTISLSGDVTGSANFDGSSNITINATVVDDSHNHIISNVDGLQVALDGKSDIAHNHNLANLAERNYTSLVGRPADDDFHMLTELLDSANDDELVIYDVSDSSYKKITRENLLAGLLSSSQFVFIRKKEEFTATEGQTVFNLTQGSYEVGTGRVDVYIWGNKQPPSAYTETSSTSITLVNGVEAGTKVLIEYIQIANVMDYIHAENHKIGGSDPISPADIGAASQSHTHVKTDITDFSHTHSISEITNLQISLDGKVNTSDVVTTATANKILKLDSNANLPANITGNAATASKLQTARTITLSGDVSGSASFNGSSNITINATVADDSHNHVISNIDNLQSTLDAKASVSHTHTFSEITGFNEATQDAIGAILTDTSTIDFTYDDTNNQIKADVKPNSSNQKVAVSKNSTTPTGTRKQINFKDGTNISITVADNATNDAVDVTITNTYTHPTGDGNLHVPATGTTNNNKVLKAGSTAGSLSWGNVDWSELTNKPSSSVSSIDNAVTNSHTHSNKALLDTYTQTEANLADAVSKKHAQNTDNTLTSSSSNTINTTGTGNIVDFKVNNTTKASVDNTGKFTGKSASADKLATARTITLTGDVTGSASFDGSANISISATVADDSHNHVISNIDNLQTILDSKAPLTSPAFTGTPTAPTAPNGTNTNQIATTKFVQNALIAGGYGDMLRSQYDTDSDGIVDRAETADKLTKARTISLSGDVTGSANFDGSGNISINATVADNSHNHTISNITNLQTELNNRVLKSGDSMTGALMGYFPSTANTMVGNEYNILLFGNKRYTITQSGTGLLNNVNALFDGILSPTYSPDGINPSNPYVLLIEGLPEIHTQTGGVFGWTSRYWYPAKYKIEFYKESSSPGWVVVRDYSTTSTPTKDLVVRIFNEGFAGTITKIRITIYESSGGSIGANGFRRWGLSEIFFYHPEAMRLYQYLDVERINGIKITVGTTAHSSPNVGDLWIDLN